MWHIRSRPICKLSPAHLSPLLFSLLSRNSVSETTRLRKSLDFSFLQTLSVCFDQQIHCVDFMLCVTRAGAHTCGQCAQLWLGERFSRAIIWGTVRSCTCKRLVFGCMSLLMGSAMFRGKTRVREVNLFGTHTCSFSTSLTFAVTAFPDTHRNKTFGRWGGGGQHLVVPTKVWSVGPVKNGSRISTRFSSKLSFLVCTLFICNWEPCTSVQFSEHQWSSNNASTEVFLVFEATCTLHGKPAPFVCRNCDKKLQISNSVFKLVYFVEHSVGRFFVMWRL